jgi:hypothetical protein
LSSAGDQVAVDDAIVSGTELASTEGFFFSSFIFYFLFYTAGQTKIMYSSVVVVEY